MEPTTKWSRFIAINWSKTMDIGLDNSIPVVREAEPGSGPFAAIKTEPKSLRYLPSYVPTPWVLLRFLIPEVPTSLGTALLQGVIQISPAFGYV
mmetsp:Transcript_141247/g.246274  ORF Transcript_141247/g.246274 Transcript_141247/m.246274 type:complete len:94 (-) Transcript_141247:1559-1840(-)